MAEHLINRLPKAWRLLRGLQEPPHEVDATAIAKAGIGDLDVEDLNKLHSIGVTQRGLQLMIQSATQMNFERVQIYREVERAQLHSMVSAAMALYSDFATTYDRTQNATVWVSSENPVYRQVLERFLARIDIEEKIFDWCHNTGSFGDLFVRAHGEPGAGIVFLDDSYYPACISRLDFNGRLVGFIDTPMGQTQDSDKKKLMPPWEYTHFRILGAVRRRYLLGNPMYTEYRTLDLVGHDGTRMSSKYGNSLLLEALPVYKRLRLTEDSLLLARLSKGILRYMYKLKVEGKNADAIKQTTQMYAELLKRTQALNLDPANQNFEDRLSDMAVNEDVIVPVWGDVGNLTFDKMGGEVDIKWIRDIEDLRRQLSIALRVPLSLLGDTSELPGTIGQSALERIDIRFSRNARRLQRALVGGITRLCQIHLAYKGYNPDPRLFTVHMSETSTAEEEELKDALKSGVEVVEKLFDLIVKAVAGEGETLDKDSRGKLLDYLNQKILKLGDLDIDSLMAGAVAAIAPVAAPEPGGAPEPGELPATVPPGEEPGGEEAGLNTSFDRRGLGDCKAFLPGNGTKKLWESTFGKLEFNIKNQEVTP